MGRTRVGFCQHLFPTHDVPRVEQRYDSRTDHVTYLHSINFTVAWSTDGRHMAQAGHRTINDNIIIRTNMCFAETISNLVQ